MEHNSYNGSVEAKIHSIANTFDKCEYMFADLAQANVNLDRMIVAKPTILFVLPFAGEFIISRGTRVIESPNVQLWFLCPSDFDFDSHINDCRVEGMKRLGVSFIDALNKSGLFEPIDKFTYQVAYDEFDANLTGVCFTLTLTEKEGILLCGGTYENYWKQ